MQYRKYGNDYILRIDRGEEIVESIYKVCKKEDIQLGSVSGIGAVGEVTLGIFNREKFIYETQSYTGDFEISACNGNISKKDGNPYLHIHMTIANPVKNVCYGGHLSRAVVSLTGEFILHQISGTVDRKYSPSVGLNLYEFADDKRRYSC